MKSWQKNLVKCGITAAIGGVMAWSVLNLHGFASASSQVEKYRILADAFTIPGVLMLMIGLLVVIANEGLFEGLSYVMSYAVKMLIPGMHKEQERFGDYVERKREKGPVTGFGFLFITGAVFMGAAILFIILFYSIY
ncbi:MAG: DUF3899 domain-containing protein [Ruminococcaceae bacterium]|nr:DUF3899 domain-containing protein [Oscillospiraceae bacterium]